MYLIVLLRLADVVIMLRLVAGHNVLRLDLTRIYCPQLEPYIKNDLPVANTAAAPPAH